VLKQTKKSLTFFGVAANEATTDIVTFKPCNTGGS
jgi:hypothetical protein